MDGPFEQYAPHLDVVSSAAVVVCALVYLVLGPFRGRVAYRRLDAARTAAVPGALVFFLRHKLRNQVAMTTVALAAVLVPGGFTAGEVGLRLPVGPAAPEMWGVTAYGCALVLVSGLIMRRRVRRGRTIPGQRQFRALIPDTAVERRWGAAVSVGAGVSEELVFRGLFTAGVAALFGTGALVASVVVCALFGLAHLYQGWLGVLGTALLSVLFAYLYLASGSLLPAVVLHVAIDLRALVLVPAQHPDAGPRRGQGRARRAEPAPRGPSAAPATDLQDAVGDDRPVLP